MTTNDCIKKTDECVKKITVQAQSHQAQGRYNDAEYLCRQLEAASAPLDPSSDSLLKPGVDMVLIYEKLGNLPAAEILQERRLLHLMTPKHWSEDAVTSREAKNLFRLYTYFLTRVKDLDVMYTSLAHLTIFCRIARLDCFMLNTLLFQSEIWTRCNSELCLHIAIRIHSTEMIRGLISIGVDINKSGDNLSPPLRTAVLYGNLDSLKLLLENNVDVGAKGANSETALHLAMSRYAGQRDETYKIICCLIEAGVDINAVDFCSLTALHSAVVHYTEPEGKVVCCLIEAGVDIEAEDRNHDTALNLAVRKGYLTTVRSLLQQGANADGHGITGQTPLFCALRYRDVAMAKLLLEHGANTESRNSERNTPLHDAVKYGQVEMVRMLLGRGASVATYNDVGKTPMDIARSNGDRILLDILLGLEN